MRIKEDTMRLTRRQLREIIEENLFDKFKRGRKNKEPLEDPGTEKDVATKKDPPKYYIMSPDGEISNENAEYLQTHLFREVGKHLGKDNGIKTRDFGYYLEELGVDIEKFEYVSSRIQKSKMVPNVQIIYSSLQKSPDRKNMDIELDMYLMGKRISSDGGRLTGIKAGQRADGQHQSDIELSRYVRNLVT